MPPRPTGPLTPALEQRPLREVHDRVVRPAASQRVTRSKEEGGGGGGGDDGLHAQARRRVRHVLAVAAATPGLVDAGVLEARGRAR